jgi:NADH dehydrogenase
VATIGRKAAVVQFKAPVLDTLKWSGTSAWLFWLLAHVDFLNGFRNRVVLLLDWGRSYLTFRRSARIVADPGPAEVKTRHS